MLDRWIKQFQALGENAFQGSEWRRLALTSETRLRQMEHEIEQVRLENALLRRALDEKNSVRGRDAT
jgi:hypothetical protein